MNRYEYEVKMWRLALIWNAIIINCIVVGVIFTHSLWWLLLLLTYKYYEEDEKKFYKKEDQKYVLDEEMIKKYKESDK